MDILSSFKTGISMYEEKVTLHSYSEDAESGGTRAEKCLVENIKQSPFQPTTKQLRLLFIFSCLGVFQLPTLNLGIPSQYPHYKSRVRNKISGEKQNI